MLPSLLCNVPLLSALLLVRGTDKVKWTRNASFYCFKYSPCKAIKIWGSKYFLSNLSCTKSHKMDFAAVIVFFFHSDCIFGLVEKYSNIKMASNMSLFETFLAQIAADSDSDSHYFPEGEQVVHPDKEDDALITGVLVVVTMAAVVIAVVVLVLVVVAADAVSVDMKMAHIIVADTVIM
ncbi:hypothetical protein PoB_006160300 [Plakobranchus ocellatus]|uniref:Uncharacterized protein n=1 Tax=Plakobranchus ocellatus TaxID=259542 RepID=A0AAV4CT24_9GAST|nr:hypothetical protein PoB_006160300 [Plakobranchus ocellatus]